MKNYALSFVIISSVVFSYTVTGCVGLLHARCQPDEMLPGPNCASFYRCIGGRYFNHVMLFSCPPGTSFNVRQSICTMGMHNCRYVVGPFPPVPISKVTSTTKFSTQKPPSTPLPPSQPDKESAPPAPISETNPQNAGRQCSTYFNDRESFYDCTRPGYFASRETCSRFHVCINTMGCIVKGFHVRCPEHFFYSSDDKKCIQRRKYGPCRYIQDAVEESFTYPVIELNTSNVDDFFKANVYWKFMPFLPTPEDSVRSERGSVNQGNNVVDRVEGPSSFRESTVNEAQRPLNNFMGNKVSELHEFLGGFEENNGGKKGNEVGLSEQLKEVENNILELQTQTSEPEVEFESTVSPKIENNNVKLQSQQTTLETMLVNEIQTESETKTSTILFATTEKTDRFDFETHLESVAET